MVNPGLNQRGDVGHNEGQPLIVECGDPKEMVELLPCPFCGATSDLLLEAMTRASDDLSWWSVECTGCGVEVTDDESQEAANRHWNKRAPTTDREKLVRAVVERCAEVANEEKISAQQMRDAARKEKDGQGALVHAAEASAAFCIASAIRSLNIDDLVKETGR